MPDAIERPIIFTDLDGTLLDHDTYSWEPAAAMLAELQRRGIPVVLNSSKTLAELERLRGKLKLLGELVMFSTLNVVFEPMQSEHLDRTVRLPFPWMNQLGLGSLMQL